jgi:hypothetical protein
MEERHLRTAGGGWKVDPEGNLQVLKKCRVHQLKPDVDVMMKFIGYDELLERFGEPDPDNYRRGL